MSVNEENMITNIDTEGHVSISTDVVATISSIAAKSIEGVSDMIGSFSGGFAEFLGKKNPGKGVKVTITDRDVDIDVSIVIEYGVKIPDLAWEVQDKIKSEVEAMTGLNVVAVNVNIEGINVGDKKTEAEKPEDENTEAEAVNED